MAATTIEYSRAPLSSNVLTICATVDLFCPTATYIQNNFLVSSLPALSLVLFWFKNVSIAIAVLPVCLSPIINSLCPLPTGIRESIAFNPVCIGSFTDCLGIIPGAFASTLVRFTFFRTPLPSIGLPNASTTLPNKPLPTGTSTIEPVLLTTSPSLMVLSLPNITTPTLSLSKLSAIPAIPPGNSTISPA